ncbi:hypothetical protein C8R48DRAFT_769418 [Suillus tomentosus]|nr:hypothetical protein C8R48DRAFT_769418 [Suillus tomentosus]
MATMILAGGIDREVELLNHSVPIWPTQLRRYTERTLPESLSRDYHVQKMQIGLAWFVAFVSDNVDLTATATPTAMKCAGIGKSLFIRLELYTTTMQKVKQWLLVVEPIIARGQEIYLYYYVVPENRIITWIEPVDAYLLFQECTAVWHWNHKRLELEAQYWKHVEYFPHGIEMHHSEVRTLRRRLNWYRIEALALEKSTAGSIFWTLEQMKEMTAELAIAEELAGSDGVMEEHGVAICGKLLHILRTLFLSQITLLIEAQNRASRIFKSPWPARSSLDANAFTGREAHRPGKPTFMTAVAVAMFWVPIMVLKRLRTIYVDGLVNGVDMKKFIDDFSAQAKSQTTVASVIMAVDASILAIPGLGSTFATKTLCSISFILSVHCIIACTLAQQFGHRMRSLDFAAYYLQGKMVSFVVILSIPSLLYLTSLIFSIFGFLAGVFAIEYGLPLSARIGCGLALVTGTGLTILLTIAAFGPGLIR